ncbi:MAG: bifunctional hydroxymethylpyrimidine kinase/phosphomethylpyrimidine kinase, partial [Cytophagales bacterium]|nr:bifunctional hydroxymethylpyrimidine kinase/phosphomethylpyrimidine kinase [Cytophagales bacterium]
SGDSLMREDALTALKEELIPLATVLTPNIPEATILLGRVLDPGHPEDMRELLQLGCRSLLLKGGHSEGNIVTDYFLEQGKTECISFSGQRISSNNTHGTGCTLSAAVASYLAQGLTLEMAVMKAKEYITKAISEGAEYVIGNGTGPVKHFYKTWKQVASPHFETKQL